jgi:hypothetical protein
VVGERVFASCTAEIGYKMYLEVQESQNYPPVVVVLPFTMAIYYNQAKF